ncbi:MAG: thioredoxin-like domain-containing protein [Chthoniobacterales bacterium]
MRWLLILLVAALAARAAAEPRPLSIKEIALMLRSGYSSESVLAEITSRRVLDPLDQATKKSMLEFGADPHLIAALESGGHVVSTSEADQVKAREAELAARRTAQIEQDRQLNTLYQAQQAEARARATPPPLPGQALILEALKSKLVRCRDGGTKPAEGSELKTKKFVALYFSAHWCGPCRKFTPELVEYYNRVAAAHPEFELVFVSSDRSRFAWETYIRETKMPWLAIDYDRLPELAGVKEIGGKSIPSLLVLDSGSRVVASSYDGENYLGPQNALAALDKIFETSPSAVAQAR